MNESLVKLGNTPICAALASDEDIILATIVLSTTIITDHNTGKKLMNDILPSTYLLAKNNMSSQEKSHGRDVDRR